MQVLKLTKLLPVSSFTSSVSSCVSIIYHHPPSSRVHHLYHLQVVCCFEMPTKSDVKVRLMNSDTKHIAVLESDPSPWAAVWTWPQSSNVSRPCTAEAPRPPVFQLNGAKAGSRSSQLLKFTTTQQPTCPVPELNTYLFFSEHKQGLASILQTYSLSFWKIKFLLQSYRD